MILEIEGIEFGNHLEVNPHFCEDLRTTLRSRLLILQETNTAFVPEARLHNSLKLELFLVEMIQVETFSGSWRSAAWFL